MVVEKLVCHWEYLVAEREGRDSSSDEGDVAQTVGRKIRDQDDGRRQAEKGHQRLTVNSALLYDNSGMVESTDPGWLQLAFETMMWLFDRVGLWTNVRKTVGMVCRICRSDGVRADEDYTRRMTGEGRSFKERQHEWVICPECRKELTKGSLVTHRLTQHSVAKGGPEPEGEEAYGGNDPRTYRLAFLAKAGPRPCPAEGCSGQASMRTGMRVKLWNRHVRDTVGGGG